MKLFSFCFSLLLLLCAATANADWKQVGKAEYNWGPFHIYTVSLFTESGNYSSEQRPLMLRIKFAKPVEGKNFAISLFKEMALDKMPADQAESLRKRLIKNFPDFKPDDVLNYIALDDEGYFVLNDTILTERFDPTFNREFIAIWLDSPSSFKQLQPRLLGEKKEEQTATTITENADATKANSSTQTADSNSTENTQQSAKTPETEEKGKADNTSVNSSHSASASTSTKKEKTMEEKPIKADGNDKSASSLSENKSAEIDKKMQPSQPRSSSTQEVTKKSADANQAAKMKESDVKNQSVNADTKTVASDKATATNTQTDDKNAANEEKTNATTDSKKSQQENSDTEQPKAQKPDAEEPIEPAIECDPILPFLKQHHC